MTASATLGRGGIRNVYALCVLCVTGYIALNPRRREAVIEPTVEAVQATHQCDCGPLWECMSSGADCTALDTQLRECLRRARNVR